MKAISEIPQLNNFDIVISGQGPPKLPPFQLFVEDPGKLATDVNGGTKIEFIEEYSFIVRCCMRSQAISMSHAAVELLGKKNIPSFGSPCSSPGCSGYFEHPTIEQVIEVPHTGCARFWVEFEFGKFLLPNVTHTFAILASVIVNCAKEVFGGQFEQGCRWQEKRESNSTRLPRLIVWLLFHTLTKIVSNSCVVVTAFGSV